VKSAYPGAKFEWLLPMDVNNPAVYWNQGYPYPQGGRLNNYVNIPSQYICSRTGISIASNWRRYRGALRF